MGDGVVVVVAVELLCSPAVAARCRLLSRDTGGVTSQNCPSGKLDLNVAVTGWFEPKDSTEPIGAPHGNHCRLGD